MHTITLKIRESWSVNYNTIVYTKLTEKEKKRREKRGGSFKSSSAMSSGSRLLPRGEHRGYSKT
jgi:hypothetical protein